MYNSESYRPTPKEEPPSSDPRAQAMNTGGSTPNEGASSGFQQLLQLASDGMHDFGSSFSPGQGPQHTLAPVVQVNGAFQVQHPPLHGNTGGNCCGGPPAPYEPNLNNATATASSCQGGGNVPTNNPYGGLPMASPNLPSGQASNLGASFQPAMAWLQNLHLHPEVLASPDEQGIPRPLWRLVDADLDYQGGDDIRVVIHFRKIRS